ncbi:MAG: hypothetical protein LBB47_06390 [Spirochaetaceae bacterium]|nr:hypothetical protein [Spirochaetaceae bacterium]
MKKKSMALCFMAIILGGGGGLFAQADKKFEEAASSIADKVKFGLEFNASILSANSEGVVDSLTDAGFNEDETKIGVGYEDELWGASAVLKFKPHNLFFLSGEIGEMFAGFPLTLDELYGWIKPFGKHFKFTGGIFDNTDGLADYTDDIDEFEMGIFIFGEDGAPFTEPEAEFTDTALTNGFLTDAIFGPVTLQLLLASNYSSKSASELGSGLLTQMAGMIGQGPVEIDTEERFFRIGGRVIADVGVGTFSALYKTFQWPMDIANASEGISAAVMGVSFTPYPGSKAIWNTFGGYFDLTAVENLGVSLGYTGFLPASDASDVDNVLYSGIDLRATWTGIEGLSLSTHNNISFAKGAEKDWMGQLGKDGSFITLYNAAGVTKEITEKFSINGVISNVFSKTDNSDAGKTEYDSFGVALKFIAKVSGNAEFNAGLRLDVEKTALSGYYGDADDSVTTFSIPIGIIVSF